MEWLRWSQRIQAIAQTGLGYAKDPYDLERYEALRAIAVEIAALHLALPEADVRAALAAESGYPTPKVDIRAAVFDDDGALLFVRETTDGLWSLPGGWADIGESPGQVAAREVAEEAGYAVRPVKLLGVLDEARHGHPPSLHYTYKLIIRCEVVGRPASSTATLPPFESVGAADKTMHETDAVEWFRRDAVPPLSRGRITEGQVRRVFDHFDQPDLPADLD